MLGWEFPPFISGGLGVHCFELTRALCQMGVEVDFFMPSHGQTTVPSSPRLRIISVGKTELMPYLSHSKARNQSSYGDNLVKAVNEYQERCFDAVCKAHAVRNYELVHAHDWLTSNAGASIKSNLNLPLVQTFHSTEFDRTSWPWQYILDLERAAVQHAVLLISVSNRTSVQLMRLGADEKKIRVIYNGVDSAKFASATVDAATLEKINKKQKVVLFLGRLTEQKGPVQFLYAAKKVLSARSDVLFFVAGKGELLPLLINMALEMGIADKVRFLGYVSDSDQQKIYKLADVYVMPSTSEPFGITALEAMSSGVPVIVSKTSGVAEIAKSVIKVDFWDLDAMAQKILAVLSYQPLAQAMGRLSSEEAQSYSWDKTAQKTLDVYQEAINIYKCIK